MAQDVTKVALSGSPGNNRRIKVTATSSPGTTIHTVTTTVGATEDIYLDAHNSSASAVTVNLEFGGTTSPDDVITLDLAPKGKGTIHLHRGTLIGAASPPVVKAWATSANVVTIGGDVARGV